MAQGPRAQHAFLVLGQVPGGPLLTDFLQIQSKAKTLLCMVPAGVPAMSPYCKTHMTLSRRVTRGCSFDLLL